MPQYHCISVMHEYTNDRSAQRRIACAVITVYGVSAFAGHAELEWQYSTQDDITILSVESP